MPEMTKEALKAQVCAAIDRRRDDILALGADLWRTPELGFKEHKTAARVSAEFAKLGIEHRTGIAITGVKGVVAGARPGPGVAVLGELDALNIPDHPECDPATGAVHACGHHGQLAALVATAIGLIEGGAFAHLAGRVAFIAVPAEEYVEIEYRNGLRREGKLEFLGGKPEFIRLGEFDDVDMALMTHLSAKAEDRAIRIAESSNGCIAKQIQYVGKASHAGGSPHHGVNALYAAQIGLTAINAQRETFRDDDHIRVHPIMTRGGDIVNVIPADVRLETFVRGKTVEAILEAEKKVDRSLRAGALAMGATVNITTLPGYLPQVNDPTLTAIYRENAAARYGAENCLVGGHQGGSTDMGDVEHIMPAIHPNHRGGGGTAHGKDYFIADPDVAFIGPAKIMAETVIDLLFADAAAAREVLAASKPRLTKDEYLASMRALTREETFVG